MLGGKVVSRLGNRRFQLRFLFVQADRLPEFLFILIAKFLDLDKPRVARFYGFTATDYFFVGLYPGGVAGGLLFPAPEVSLAAIDSLFQFVKLGFFTFQSIFFLPQFG